MNFREVDYKTDIKRISEYSTSGIFSGRYYALQPENLVVNEGRNFLFYLGIMPSSERLINEYREGAQIRLEGIVLQRGYGLVDSIVSLGLGRPGKYPHGFRGKILVGEKEKYHATLVSSEIAEMFWDTRISEIR